MANPIREEHMPGGTEDLERVRHDRENVSQRVRIADTAYLSKTYAIADNATQEVDVESLMGRKGNSFRILTDKDINVWVNSQLNDTIYVPATEDLEIENFEVTKIYIKNPATYYGSGVCNVRVLVTG